MRSICGIHAAHCTLTWLQHPSPRSHSQGGIKLHSVLRIVCLFLLGGFVVTAGFGRLGNASQADQDVQVIEVAAKKYEYTPSPIRVKRGAQVQFRDHVSR